MPRRRNMEAPEKQIQLVQAESARLKEYLTALPPDAWHQPSACGRWQVRDVVVHLAGGAEVYADMISRGLQGDAAPPPGLLAGGTITATSFSEITAQRVIARSKSLGAQVLATFNTTNDTLNHLLVGLTPTDWLTPCYYRPLGGTIPVQAFIGLRLRELAMHGWDIRAKLEPAPHLSTASLPVFMQAVPNVVRWAFRPGARLPIPLRYRFVLTGAVSRTTDIVVEGDTVHLEEAGEAAAQGTFGCDTETFVLLLHGRVALGAAVVAGHVSVEGDRELAGQFDQWFRGI
jgi:uncharacterized protein (TIGR03083 family)